jgi:hypothetical protein
VQENGCIEGLDFVGLVCILYGMRAYVEFQEQDYLDMVAVGDRFHVLVSYQEDMGMGDDEDFSPEAWVVFFHADGPQYSGDTVIWEYTSEDFGGEPGACLNAMSAAREFAAAHGGCGVVLDDWRTRERLREMRR